MSEQRKKNKLAYDEQYAKENVFVKRVPFNRNNDEDQKILDHVEGKNFSRYVKDLILDDMPGE